MRDPRFDAHFDYVAGEAAKGVGALAMGAKIPITFGVLTTDSIEQAIERAGTKAGNKGFDAAMAAVEMVGLFRQIDGGASVASVESLETGDAGDGKAGERGRA